MQQLTTAQQTHNVGWSAENFPRKVMKTKKWTKVEGISFFDLSGTDLWLYVEQPERSSYR